MEGQNQNTNPTPGGNAGEQVMKSMNSLEAWLAPIFEKFPHLPQGGRDFLVMIAPWYALVFGVLSLTAIFGLVSLLGVASMTGGAFGYGMYGGASNNIVVLGISIASGILMLLAFTSLKAHARKGWNFLFYSEVVSIAGGVVGSMMTYGYGLAGTAIGAVIGLYILFEIRGSYK